MRTKPYVLTFHTKEASIGFAVVNAMSPGQAEAILKSQGRYKEEVYHVEVIEELFSPCDDLSIVTEAILYRNQKYSIIDRMHSTDSSKKKSVEEK